MSILRTINYSVRTMLISILIGSSCVQASFACDFIGWSTFSELAQENTVIKATIKAHGPRLPLGNSLHTTMNVEVTDVVKGQYEYDGVTFAGDLGASCRAYISSKTYKIGSEHLFIVSSEGPLQDLWGMGEWSVRIIDGRVHGTNIIDYNRVPYAYDLSEFITLLRSED